MKYLLMAFAMLINFTTMAQTKVDLYNVTLKEDIEPMVKDIQNVHKGLMFDKLDMVSYGVSDNKSFYLKDYLPAHVELLSYKGQLAGFAFRMKTYEDQQKVEQYLNEKYALVPAIQKATYVKSTEYRDNNVLIQFDAIAKESFAKGMTGYLNFRRTDFSDLYEKLMAE